MTWDEYYEKADYWSVSTLVKKLSTLENVGTSKEISDVINIIGFEDKKGATRLLNKAIQSGIKFSGEELVDIWDLCDQESVNKAIQLSADQFTTTDLEDLSLCISEEEIIEIAKKYEVNIPKDIADENEEVLCDATAPISWNRFYEAFYEWSKDYAVKRSQSLTDYGDEEEVIEVVNELYVNNIDDASAFISRALDYGVRFNADNLIELPLLCDRETVKKAVLSSSISFDQNDLEVLYGYIEDEIIGIAAKKYNLKLPEDMQENYVEYIDDEPIQVDQPTKKLGGFLVVFLVVNLDNQKNQYLRKKNVFYMEYIRTMRCIVKQWNLIYWLRIIKSDDGNNDRVLMKCYMIIKKILQHQWSLYIRR